LALLLLTLLALLSLFHFGELLAGILVAALAGLLQNALLELAPAALG